MSAQKSGKQSMGTFTQRQVLCETGTVVPYGSGPSLDSVVQRTRTNRFLQNASAISKSSNVLISIPQ